MTSSNKQAPDIAEGVADEAALKLIAKLTAENEDLKSLASYLRNELQCIFQLSELVDRHNYNITLILDGLLDILHNALAQQQDTDVRITLRHRVVSTPGFDERCDHLVAAIRVANQEQGRIELARNSGFFSEEKLLLNVVSERIGKVVERVEAVGQLESERAAVTNTNIALKEVLARVQEEKLEIGRSIHDNVTKIVLPMIYDLEQQLIPNRFQLFDLLKRQLEDLTAPFASALSQDFHRLTMTELQICNLILKGMSSKAIAKLRGSAPSTVHRQRDRIREKLGLRNQSINLEMFLQQYAQEIQNIIKS
jgi:DNA-binding CsgD family transcriptional regulator